MLLGSDDDAALQLGGRTKERAAHLPVEWAENVGRANMSVRGPDLSKASVCVVGRARPSVWRVCTVRVGLPQSALLFFQNLFFLAVQICFHFPLKKYVSICTATLINSSGDE